MGPRAPLINKLTHQKIFYYDKIYRMRMKKERAKLSFPFSGNGETQKSVSDTFFFCYARISVAGGDEWDVQRKEGEKKGVEFKLVKAIGDERCVMNK